MCGWSYVWVVPCISYDKSLFQISVHEPAIGKIITQDELSPNVIDY